MAKLSLFGHTIFLSDGDYQLRNGMVPTTSIVCFYNRIFRVTDQRHGIGRSSYGYAVAF